MATSSSSASGTKNDPKEAVRGRNFPRAGRIVLANGARSAHSRSVKIIKDARKHAAEQAIAEEEALKNGMEEKSREFTEKGSEIYAKA